jgi:hypothetical protein
MRRISKVLIFGLMAGSSTPGMAGEPSYSLLDPSAYQSFVANWKPANKPLCAVIQSQADWAAVFRPAPVMGTNRPFGPPAELWSDGAVLMLARVVDAGDTANVFHLIGIHRDKDVIDVDVSFHRTPAASSRIKWWLGVTVSKTLPPMVRFREDGRVICTIQPGSCIWLRSMPAGK